jgi:serine protease SohB
MTFLAAYGLFIAKFLSAIVLLLIFFGVILLMIMTGKSKKKEAGKIHITHLNDHYHEVLRSMQEELLPEKAFKKLKKADQQAEKKKATEESDKKKIYYLKFHGDIKASGLTELRKCITAVLLVAKPDDEIVLNLESGGGLVHAYGLCASQLQRIRDHGIPLTITIDKVAASGGYMMACVANQIIAAPFAIIGSIGVLIQIPNFNKLLQHHRIEFEQLSAGEFKRTLSLFGKNTEKGREKMQEEVEEAHVLFKKFITDHRPHVNIAEVATGEHWFAKQAIDLKLIDKISTSDEYLLEASKFADIYQVEYQTKKTLPQKLSHTLAQCVEQIFLKIWQQQKANEII